MEREDEVRLEQENLAAEHPVGVEADPRAEGGPLLRFHFACRTKWLRDCYVVMPDGEHKRVPVGGDW